MNTLKKILVFSLMLISTSLYAQKSYIVLVSSSHFYSDRMQSTSYNLYGNIPDGVNKSYSRLDEALNALGQENYAIESVNLLQNYHYRDDHDVYINYDCTIILSRSSNISLKIETISADDDEYDVYEIARYNLQGKPIDANERGIQIIVYSNYTTKIIFVE